MRIPANWENNLEKNIKRPPSTTGILLLTKETRLEIIKMERPVPS
jgi:hypothetical protein